MTAAKNPLLPIPNFIILDENVCWLLDYASRTWYRGGDGKLRAGPIRTHKAFKLRRWCHAVRRDLYEPGAALHIGIEPAPGLPDDSILIIEFNGRKKPAAPEAHPNAAPE
jgi:hypothetical protein